LNHGGHGEHGGTQSADKDSAIHPAGGKHSDPNALPFRRVAVFAVVNYVFQNEWARFARVNPGA